MNCVYLGDETDAKGGRKEHVCRRHGRCLAEGSDPKTACCGNCNDLLTIDDPEFAGKWVDPLLVTDRNGNGTDVLRGLLAGGIAFLFCGGPSANDLPLEDLGRRGIWSLAVNNAAGHKRVRPQAFVFSDPPKKFSHSVWLDPGVMKFCPQPKLRKGRSGLRRKHRDGSFSVMNIEAYQCPNVWGFRRESWLTPDDAFFLNDGACWGNLNSGVKRTGQEKTVCTMLLGLRLLYHLGARRVYLIGVDFWMAPDRGYSFGQDRTPGAAESNNRQFAVVNRWLCEMQRNGTFDRFSLEVYNCCERSGLRAFPFVPFGDAVGDAVGIIEQEPDLKYWYEKFHCLSKECGSQHVRPDEEKCECLDCGMAWDWRRWEAEDRCPDLRCGGTKLKVDGSNRKCLTCGLRWKQKPTGGDG